MSHDGDPIEAGSDDAQPTNEDAPQATRRDPAQAFEAFAQTERERRREHLSDFDGELFDEAVELARQHLQAHLREA
ncbi:hypothetical protein [Thiohalorhabdus sp.]|uniref:hypothetical protein n=1 Tax=Thiohalorhabdus sp. TaxID=3094134 RepID=UPI002FC391D4